MRPILLLVFGTLVTVRKLYYSLPYVFGIVQLVLYWFAPSIKQFKCTSKPFLGQFWLKEHLIPSMEPLKWRNIHDLYTTDTSLIRTLCSVPSVSLFERFDCTLKNIYKSEWRFGASLKRWSVLRKCNSKFDCLVYKMIYEKVIKPSLNTQANSIRVKLFTWHFRTFFYSFLFLLLCFLPWALYPLDPQIFYVLFQILYICFTPYTFHFLTW